MQILSQLLRQIVFFSFLHKVSLYYLGWPSINSVVHAVFELSLLSAGLEVCTTMPSDWIIGSCY